MCRRVEGYLSQVLQMRANHNTFQLYNVHIEDRPDLAKRFKIEEVPTLLVIEGTRITSRVACPRGCGPIKEFLSPWLR